MEKLSRVLICIVVLIIAFFFIIGCKVGVSVDVDPGEIKDVIMRGETVIDEKPKEKEKEKTGTDIEILKEEN